MERTERVYMQSGLVTAIVSNASVEGVVQTGEPGEVMFMSQDTTLTQPSTSAGVVQTNN